MIVLESNLKEWTNEEIKALMEFNSMRKRNTEKGNNIIEQINPLKQAIDPMRKKCNEIISKEVVLSKDSSKTLLEESKKMRPLLTAYSKLEGKLSEFRQSQKEIDENEKKLSEKVNSRLNPVEEKKFNFNFRLFKKSTVPTEQRRQVAVEKIETTLDELNMLSESIRFDMANRDLLKFQYNNHQISESDYNLQTTELNKNISKKMERKSAKEKIVSAYNEIRDCLAFIMRYDVINKKKHCSANQYKKYISDMCDVVREKSARIQELREYVSEGLLLSLANMYNISNEYEMTDVKNEENEVVSTRQFDKKLKTEESYVSEREPSSRLVLGA